MNTLAKVKAGDRVITIEPFKVKHLDAVARHAVPIIQDIQAGKPLTSVLARNVNHLIGLVTETGIVEKEWLEEQSPAVLLDILAAVVEVNADFFMKTLPQQADQEQVAG